MKNSNLNKFFILVTFIFLVSNVYANCDESQIEINTASLEKLEELYGIGPVKAQSIIEARTFSSVDDLIKVNGIGEATLQKIKEQGLACVKNVIENESEKVYSELKVEKNKSEEDNSVEKLEENKEKEVVSQEESNTKITSEMIKLDAKSIKSQTNSENSTKRYATYGLIFFCILLSILFMINRKKIFAKNEFN